VIRAVFAAQIFTTDL